MSNEEKKPYTIERCDRIARYQHVVVWAQTPEEACRIAVEGDHNGRDEPLEWDLTEDYDSAGPTYIDEIVEGEFDEPYDAAPQNMLDVPAEFKEPLHPHCQVMREALEAATAFVELSTGSGVQKQPPQRYIKADGDFDAEAIARDARDALAIISRYWSAP